MSQAMDRVVAVGSQSGIGSESSRELCETGAKAVRVDMDGAADVDATEGYYSDKVGDSALKTGGKDSNSKQEVNSAVSDVAMRSVFAILSGLVFGVALVKSGVHRADVLRGQFVFDNWIMMLVFLSATATSSILMNAMYELDATKDLAMQSGGKKHLKSGAMGLASVSSGAFLLGCGMSIAGACPGTSYAQLGGGAYGTLATIAGGILGAYVFGWSYDSLMLPFMQMWSIQNRSLPDMLGMPRWVLAGAFSALLWGVIGIILAFGYEPLEQRSTEPTVFLMEHWHPVVAGVLIGSVQLPLILGVRKNLGASTSYAVAASGISGLTGAVGFGDNDYTKKFRDSFEQIWQVVFVVAAVAGAALAAGTSGVWYKESEYTSEVHPAMAVIGGFLIVFGGRLAGGCTSGHGISGASHLSLTSFVSLAAMFAGAIGSAFVMRAAGAL